MDPGGLSCSLLRCTLQSEISKLKPHKQTFFILPLFLFLFLAFYWNVHYEQWVYESWHLFVFNFFFSTFCWIWNLRNNQEHVITTCVWAFDMVIMLIFVMFVYIVHVLYLHNAQHSFVLFYYVKKLIKGLFDLGVGLLCLGFWSKVCCAFVLFYRFNARYGPFTIGVPKRSV